MISGSVYKFGDNINTDIIYPGKYLSITTDREEMAKHCFESVFPEFMKKARPGVIIVAGSNFGCGSSREQAATCLKYFGVGAIIAKSFARIFYRNAINLGLPVIAAPDVPDQINNDDDMEIELDNGVIRNNTTNAAFKVETLPPFIMGIIKVGGLIPYLRKKLNVRSQEVR
jgi:3-isopropylmalate/(R)-2-methylmalate dehydratase small subunit